MPRLLGGGTSPLDHWPYVHAMSMRVPQEKLLNVMLALNGVSANLSIGSCCAVDCSVPLCRPTMPGRTAITSPTANSAAANPTATDVSHRDRRLRQRTLS